MQKNLTQAWNDLRAKKPHMNHFLDSIRIFNLRGIGNLPVSFNYPVSVIAGTNGTGKSTVLLGCACAYDIPKETRNYYTPGILFPRFRSRFNPKFSDVAEDSELEYFFSEHGIKVAMSWRRLRAWTKSFMGRRNERQPRRPVYLRALSNITNYSEMSSALQIGNQEFDAINLDPDLVAFAYRVLPFRYHELSLLKIKNRDLLIAQRKDAAPYSEFHISAGERALLRLSKDISQLQDALILIDDVEFGLHPQTQRQLMLELQRLAIDHDLQIVVTTHSPVILECVPPEGRIFLDRNEKDIVVQPPYSDIFQRAFYARTQGQLSILCEDTIAEALIFGIMDRLTSALNLIPGEIIVARNTSKKNQFAQNIDMLGKSKMLEEFIFVLDGDARNAEAGITKAANRYNCVVAPQYLPGKTPLEDWMYQILERNVDEYTQYLGAPNLGKLLKNLRQLFENDSGHPTHIVKSRYTTLAELLQRTPEDIARIMGRIESARDELKIFADGLAQAITDWRNRT